MKKLLSLLMIPSLLMGTSANDDALYDAIMNDSLYRVKKAIKKGALIDGINPFDLHTPLSRAISNDKKSIARYLLKHGADVTVPIHPEIPANVALITATLAPDSAILLQLLEEFDIPQDAIDYALHEVISYYMSEYRLYTGYEAWLTEKVTILLNHYADPMRSYDEDRFGHNGSAYELAMQHGLTDVTHLMDVCSRVIYNEYCECCE